MSKKIDL
jgi:hypothetical protein